MYGSEITGGIIKVELSEKFVLKFFEKTFKPVSTSWFATIYYQLIDSRYRTRKKLDDFLKEQISNPSPELLKIAQELRDASKSPDELIIKVLKHVNLKSTYISDQLQWGYADKWEQASDVYNSGKNDCDGQNSLIYVLARLAGVSGLCLWSCLGDVNGGYHYWNIYFSPKEGKWYSIDSTYYPDMTNIEYREEFELNNDYYKTINFVFNEDFTLKHR